MKLIDEKNKKLLGLKIATGKISSVLLEEKNTLQKEIEECQRLINEIDDRNKKIANTQIKIHDMKKESAQLEKKKKKFNVQLEHVLSPENEDIPDVSNARSPRKSHTSARRRPRKSCFTRLETRKGKSRSPNWPIRKQPKAWELKNDTLIYLYINS